MGWRRPADEPLRDGGNAACVGELEPRRKHGGVLQRGTRRRAGPCSGARRPLDRGGPSPNHLILVRAPTSQWSSTAEGCKSNVQVVSNRRAFQCPATRLASAGSEKD